MAQKGNLFNTVKMSAPSSNRFDLSHDVKMSMNMGDLVPILALECVPGDRHNISAEALIRLAPMVAPVMHRMDCTIHYFFVPNRILWPNWEKFITNDATNPAHPTLTYDKGIYDSVPLIDYMGLPDPGSVITPNNLTVSALPFAAYAKIYDDYYRDQNNIVSDWEELADGDNAFNFMKYMQMRKRAWEHDYFTSCLPFAQKGSAVDIPLGEITLDPDWDNNPTNPFFVNELSAITTGAVAQDGGIAPSEINVGADSVPSAYDPQGSLINEPTTINDLRRAFKLQEFLEKLARGGSRMTEFILSIFGVKSSDARLNRPEYITGTKAPVQISEVLNTSDTVDAPQGNMAGHGISVTNGKNGSYYCEEYGWIIGIMSVLPRTAYFQGIPRQFQKFDNLDYYTPQFANIGEQEVYNKEIYVEQGAPEAVFGYLPRYTEYKYMHNRVAGDFKTSLDYWHMARKFAGMPTLSQAFIEADPTHRIFAVTDPTEQKLYCQIYNNVQSSRKMPKYGTPTF